MPDWMAALAVRVLPAHWMTDCVLNLLPAWPACLWSSVLL